MAPMRFIREFNLGHIMTIVVLIIAGVGAHYATQDRIQELELRAEFAQEAAATMNLRTVEILKELSTTDNAVDKRLDKLEADLRVHIAEGHDR